MFLGGQDRVAPKIEVIQTVKKNITIKLDQIFQTYLDDGNYFSSIM